MKLVIHCQNLNSCLIQTPSQKFTVPGMLSASDPTNYDDEDDDTDDDNEANVDAADADADAAEDADKEDEADEEEIAVVVENDTKLNRLSTSNLTLSPPPVLGTPRPSSSLGGSSSKSPLMRARSGSGSLKPHHHRPALRHQSKSLTAYRPTTAKAHHSSSATTTSSEESGSSPRTARRAAAGMLPHQQPPKPPRGLLGRSHTTAGYSSPPSSPDSNSSFATLMFSKDAPKIRATDLLKIPLAPPVSTPPPKPSIHAGKCTLVHLFVLIDNNIMQIIVIMIRN